MDLELIPIQVFIEHILKYLSISEYLKLLQVKKSLRDMFLRNSEQVWRMFLYRDYQTFHKDPTFFETYKDLTQSTVSNVYMHPLLTCTDVELITNVMLNLDGFNSHIFFIKKEKYKYSVPLLGLHTNVGAPYYSLTGFDGDLPSRFESTGQIEALFSLGYRAIIGILAGGKEFFFSQMSNKEYTHVKAYIECINAKNKRVIHERLKMYDFV